MVVGDGTLRDRHRACRTNSRSISGCSLCAVSADGALRKSQRAQHVDSAATRRLAERAIATDRATCKH